ncbi:MAG: hypothetical protein RSA29_15475 [Clostridium sp.]|uniref:hypothetical protein n=1 Tax=Clostridium sp. TaxID=1506 RepID=UPI00304DB7E8
MMEKGENLKVDNENEEELMHVPTEVKETEDVQQVIDSYIEEEDIMVGQESEVVEIKNPGFFSKLGANVIDQAIGLAVSFILLYVFNIIIGFIGYRVGDKVAVFLVIYVLFNVLYGIILENTKSRKTIGKAIVKL